MTRFLVTAALLSLATACDAPEQDTETAPTAASGERGTLGKADLPGSCESEAAVFCEGQSPQGCWCDAQCRDFGDCCSDAGEVCEADPQPEPEPEPQPEPTGCEVPATYLVEVDMNWTTPGVPNRHWSPLIGATHTSAVDFWSVGGFSTSGFEVMAETGAPGPLRSEVEGAVANGTAASVLSGSGISTGDGSTSFEFEISADAPEVTLVSMMAPSPDWFVGLGGVSLCQGDTWISGTAQMQVFDAGTDSGTSFTSPNADTSPAGAIGLEPLFIGNNGQPTSVGTMTFTRL